MAEAMLFNIAESLIKKLGSKALEEIAAAWGFKDQLKKLNRRANSIKCLLSDAEEKQVRSHQVRDWLEQLSSVVYDADDLFDEFSTKAMRKELRKELMPGCTLSKEDG
ncbi:hypothetical protein Dimus_034917 [Dionaea muscipula]